MAPLLADRARRYKERLLHIWRRARLMAAKCAIAMVIATWVHVVLEKLLKMLFSAMERLEQMPKLSVIRDYRHLFLRHREAVTEFHTGWDSEAVTEYHTRCDSEAVTEYHTGSWDSLPYEIQGYILGKVEFEDLFRLKVVSKSLKNSMESDAFTGIRLHSDSWLTALNYYIKNKALRCSGFDLHSNSWKALPPFSCLPPPDDELFKEYFVCGHGGLMCADVSKLPKKGELVVFNPSTGVTRALPPLVHPRNPVLIHIVVNSEQKSYKVIVAGSSTASDEHFSRKVEVFESSTSEWKETTDLPGPAFGLNEHQAGVYLDGTLFFISFLEGDCGLRSVLALDVENGKWLENWVCPIPFSLHSNILQLVENDGKLYLFSEQERGESMEHCIDVLECSSLNAGAMDRQWRNVVRVQKRCGEGLLVYPEYQCYVEDFSCVGFGEGKMCIFDTLTRDGVVYDMRDGKQLHVLEPPPPRQTGDNFYTLNPASFTFQPSFISDPSFSMPTR